MLLFLLSENFREPRHAPRLAPPTKGAYANELLASGLVLSVWCVLRLVTEHGELFAVDVALALPCLAFGLWVVLQSARILGSRRGKPLANALRAAKRVQRRNRRLTRENARSDRRS